MNLLHFPTRPLLVLGACFVSLPVLLLFLLPNIDKSLLVEPALIAAERPLWLIAHPDDEALFFSPSIINLLAEGSRTGHILSLSTGNADGHGEMRAAELVKSCATLGIDQAHCVSAHDSRLPDSMQARWKADDVLDVLEPWLTKWSIDAIITFDDYGVSGHLNHQAIPAALESTTSPRFPPVYTLRSSSMASKFSNILTLPAACWAQYQRGPATSSLLLSGPSQVQLARRAFEHHASQAVWFRTLYCHFSKYLWWNELDRLTPQPARAIREGKDEL